MHTHRHTQAIHSHTHTYHYKHAHTGRLAHKNVIPGIAWSITDAVTHTDTHRQTHSHAEHMPSMCTYTCVHLPAHMYVIPAALSITHTLAWLLSDAHIQVPWILLSNWTVCWQGLWVLNDCQICHRPKRFIFSLNLLISCQESPLQCDQPAGIMLYNCNHKK